MAEATDSGATPAATVGSSSARPPTADEPRPQGVHGLRSARAKELAHTLIVSLILAVVVRVGIAQAYEVDGPSMEPTLLTGEKLLVARCAYGLAVPGIHEQLLSWALPSVGDVVIVASPQNPEEDLVKRVIGLPGDVIEVRNDEIFRNGSPLSLRGPKRCPPDRFRTQYPECQTFREGSGEDQWWISHSYMDWNQTLQPRQVPAGHIYVLGDHRSRSNDSRAFGPVRANLLRGRVLFID